jgi:predicted DsbA family dithiol-disulfide isomerase
MPTPAIVYSDFNCPFCYALNEQLHALGMAEGLVWRGVQHAPHLPVPMVPWTGPLAEELQREVRAVRRLAPELPIAVPPGKPNTGRAIRAAALALQMDPGRGEAFKNLLYAALWRDGADLSNPAILDHLGEQAGVGEGIAGKAERQDLAQTAAAWQEEWERQGYLSVPTVMRADGEQLIGFPGGRRVRQFFAAADCQRAGNPLA